jgi:hypothetical protein
VRVDLSQLSEEIRLQPLADPPHLWHQEVVADGHAVGYDGVINDYFLVRVEPFTPKGPTSEAELLVDGPPASPLLIAS